MIIYIAAPYTKGDVAENIHKVLEAADELVIKGHTPYIPHLTHFWHLVSPKPIGFWYAYDLVFLEFCDALLRLDGDSTGADAEVIHARQLSKHIFSSMNEVPDANNQ